MPSVVNRSQPIMKTADIRKRPKCIIKKNSISQNRLKRIKDWCTLYRRNLPLFIKHYFQIGTLHDYQKMMLYEIGCKSEITICASRATAKSWIVGLAAIAIAVLYPKSEIIVVSSYKSQAGIIIGKIQDFYNEYPNVRREIIQILINDNKREVTFANLSKIKVVALSDGARGNRGTFIIREECNSVRKKELLDSVVSPMKYIRPAPFRNKDEYKHLIEDTKMVSISSAGLKQNWWYWYTIQQIYIKCFGDKTGLVRKEDVGFLAFDYLTSIEHHIKSAKDIASDKKTFDYITFECEYRNIPYGINENAFFTFDSFEEARTIKQAFYPRRLEEYVSGKWKYTIKKIPGEKRVIAADLASSAAKNSDNSSYVCARLLPTANKGYVRNIVYLETLNGITGPAQALRLRQLMTDFEADALVLDMRNLGTTIFQIMTDVIKDDERGCEYPPITVAYHETIANKYDEYMQQTISPNAIPCIYPIHATAELNSNMAVNFKDKLKTGMIKMLVSTEEAEKKFHKDIGMRFYTPEVGDWGGRPWLLAPYEQTTQLINEALALSVYVQNGNIKLVEPKKSTKDRIISLMYLNYYASLLDSELLKNDDGMDLLKGIEKIGMLLGTKRSGPLNRRIFM